MPLYHDPGRLKGEEAEVISSASPIMRNPTKDYGGKADMDEKNSIGGSRANENLRMLGVRKKPMGKGVEVRDRTELMERIKRGESPTWIPSKAVGILHLDVFSGFLAGCLTRI